MAKIDFYNNLLWMAAQDVRYWRLLHAETCPNCGIAWAAVHPEANLIPHWHGDCKKAVQETQEAADREFCKTMGIAVLGKEEAHGGTDTE